MYFYIILTILASALTLTSCTSTKTTDQTGSTASGNMNADTQHSSRNALDWQGIYRGTLPCADCKGIKTEITLNQDLTYEMISLYLAKSDQVFREKGTFTWNEKGGNITLRGGQAPETQQYQVGENLLRKLDTNGQQITGNLAQNYILKKAGTDQTITEKYWKLIELKGKKISPAENQLREPHFILKTEDTRVTGNSGCNNFTGSYQLISGNKISFKPIAATRMACMDVNYENEYLKVFETADNYTLKGDTLSLNKARMAPLARFVTVYLR